MRPSKLCTFSCEFCIYVFVYQQPANFLRLWCSNVFSTAAVISWENDGNPLIKRIITKLPVKSFRNDTQESKKDCHRGHRRSTGPEKNPMRTQKDPKGPKRTQKDSKGPNRTKIGLKRKNGKTGHLSTYFDFITIQCVPFSELLGSWTL